MTSAPQDMIRCLHGVVGLLHDDARRQQEAGGGAPLDSAALHRAAFFAMARLLIEQAWRGIDGGCPALRRPRDEDAWYGPSPAAAAAAMGLLSSHNWHDLPGDVLGAAYEEYLDEHERRAKGQYYTPRPVVSFIWDRVGFDGRGTPRIVDPCAGPGGFLVEAAQRIRLAVLPAGFDADDPAALEGVALDDLRRAAQTILKGLHGVEITSFACRLAEVNLWLQAAPLLRAISRKSPDAVQPLLELRPDIQCGDALEVHALRTADDNQGSRQDACPTKTSRQDACSTDYVCSNPPYLGEKGNKELFRRVRRTAPYWDQFYQGKMDYFYWFIILGLQRLRPGGRLGYVTTGYWHTADGGALLRSFILDHAKILEMHDFGPVRMFSGAPGQHNLVVILQRCDDQSARRRHTPKLVKVKEEFAGATADERLTRMLDHIQRHIAIRPGEEFEDEKVRVFRAPAAQGELSGAAWNIFHDQRTAAVLQQIERAGEPLGRVCRYLQGVVSGADRVVRRHFRHLSPAVVAEHGIQEGDGIFVLRGEELDRLGLSPHERSLAWPTYKNSQVRRYVVDVSPAGAEYLLYVVRRRGVSPENAPRLLAHLEKFREVLQRRRECHSAGGRAGRPARQWFELHWPRDEQVLRGEKLVTPRRAPRNCFAYVTGQWCENSDLAVLARRPGVREGLKYLLALLNSAALDFWYAHRGKKKGKLREYYHTPLTKVPIRRIRFEPASGDAAKRSFCRQLRQCLDTGQPGAAYALVADALRAGQEDLVHDGLEILVDRIMGGVGAKRSEADDEAIQSVMDRVVLDLYGVSAAADRELILSSGQLVVGEKRAVGRRAASHRSASAAGKRTTPKHKSGAVNRPQ